jgi:hypothetical protein
MSKPKRKPNNRSHFWMSKPLLKISPHLNTRKSQGFQSLTPLRGASYYSHGVERTLDKLPSRRQGRSPLKYIICRLCISLERKVCPLKESLDFHKYCGQVFLHRINFWPQNFQNSVAIETFWRPISIGCWPLV